MMVHDRAVDSLSSLEDILLIMHKNIIMHDNRNWERSCIKHSDEGEGSQGARSLVVSFLKIAMRKLNFWHTICCFEAF